MKPLAKIITALLLSTPIGMNAYAVDIQTQNTQQQSMQGMQHDQGGMQGMQHGQGGMGMQGMQQGQGGMQGMQHGQGGMGMMSMMGMMGGMSEEQMDQHMRMKQENMLQMHELSNKILAATDPAEKEKLKKQQLDLMKQHHKQMMQMMHGSGQKGAAPQNKEPAPKQGSEHQKHSNM